MGVKCKEIIFNPKNHLYFILSGGTPSIIPQYDKDTIVSLAMPENNFITVGDTLKIKGDPYKVNIITKVEENKILTYYVKVAERTKSSIFVLPMLSGDKNLFLYDSHLVNAFIGYSDSIDTLVLLYKWSEDTLFAKFNIALTKFPTFIKSFNPDSYHVVYIFDIPEKHKRNFKLFKAGKYSKLTDAYKLQVLQFHKLGADSALSKILFKSFDRKLELEEKFDCELPENSELLSIIDMKNEILNLNYYL